MERIPKTAAIDSDARTDRGRATFTHLILRHEAELSRVARRLCGGDDDRAQDFVQDTLVRAYRACLSDYFQEGGNPRAWLIRVVTNLYINDYHHRRRWEAGDGLNSPAAHKRVVEASQRAALAGTPAALLMAATLDEVVERALDALPVKLRLCVILVDLEGQEYGQAADALGIPLGTVRSRLSRARGLLQPLLRDYARRTWRGGRENSERPEEAMKLYTIQATETLSMISRPPLSEMYHLSPWVWRTGGGYGLLLRAVPRNDDPKKKISRIYSGVSEDGTRFVLGDKPVISPGPEEYDVDGCEDPTQVQVDGMRYVYYSGWNQSREEGQLLLAVGPDRGPLEKRGVRLPSSEGCQNPKEAATIQLMDGTWRLLFEYTADEASKIGMASAPSIDGPWTVGEPPFTARPGQWDSWHLSAGPMLKADPKRPVMLYNGSTKDIHWRIGWAMFNEDMTHVIARSDDPLITPPAPTGDDSDIAFAASAFDQGDEVWLYYSVADRYLYRATLTRAED